MSKNFVAAGNRLSIRATVTHTAGDLVYEKGFIGVVQDNVAVGDLFSLIGPGEWNLARLVGGAAPVAMGAPIFALPTLSSTGLLIAPAASAGASAGIGWTQIGRLAATSNASQAKVILAGFGAQ
jgi:predicted RecA/RadA family phage recombinase